MPKEINDIHISMTVELITLRQILVNINQLCLLTIVNEKLNDSLKWQCIFDTTPSPIVIYRYITLRACKTRSFAKLQHCECYSLFSNNILNIISWLLMKTQSQHVSFSVEIYSFSLEFYVLLTKHNGHL